MFKIGDKVRINFSLLYNGKIGTIKSYNESYYRVVLNNDNGEEEVLCFWFYEMVHLNGIEKAALRIRKEAGNVKS